MRSSTLICTIWHCICHAECKHCLLQDDGYLKQPLKSGLDIKNRRLQSRVLSILAGAQDRDLKLSDWVTIHYAY